MQLSKPLKTWNSSQNWKRITQWEIYMILEKREKCSRSKQNLIYFYGWPNSRSQRLLKKANNDTLTFSTLLFVKIRLSASNRLRLMGADFWLFLRASLLQGRRDSEPKNPGKWPVLTRKQKYKCHCSRELLCVSPETKRLIKSMGLHSHRRSQLGSGPLCLVWNTNARRKTRAGASSLFRLDQRISFSFLPTFVLET